MILFSLVVLIFSKCVSHKALGLATTMDVLWFQSHQKLHNIGKNILKLTNEDVTLDKICEHFGPHQVKMVGNMTKSLN
jgi:hypothetical protein